MEKTVILNQNRDFLQLYQRGKKIASPYVIIYLRKTRRKHNRLGITVGKKVGCAVKRSRARRIIRQAYRETEHLMPVGVDMVIVALPSITGIRSTQLRDYLAATGVRRLRRKEENRNEVPRGGADPPVPEGFPTDSGCVPVLSDLFLLCTDCSSAVWCGAGRLSRPAPSAALSPVESRRH